MTFDTPDGEPKLGAAKENSGMKEGKAVRRGRIGAPVTRPTSWWLRTLQQRRESMYDDEEALAPIEFESDEERRACISFFNAALRAEESGSAQAERLADEVRSWDPELAECLQLYGAEEQWHRGLIEQFLVGIGGHVQPLGGLTGIFYRAYGRARDLETIMLTNLMFEVIGSTTYRIALGRVKHPAVRKILTILARDESFHVPLNVHFIREMRRHRQSGWLQTARLKSIYHVVFWMLLASAAASRRVAERFDGISFGELSHAYAENLARLFVHESDLRFTPPSLALRLFALDKKELLDGDNVLSAAAAEASARRADVEVRPLDKRS
jgi:hypothetical protein